MLALLAIAVKLSAAKAAIWELVLPVLIRIRQALWGAFATFQRIQRISSTSLAVLRILIDEPIECEPSAGFFVFVTRLSHCSQ